MSWCQPQRRRGNNNERSNGQNAPCHLASSIPSLALADDVKLSDIEPRFICEACGRRGADLRRIMGVAAWLRELRRLHALRLGDVTRQSNQPATTNIGSDPSSPGVSGKIVV